MKIKLIYMPQNLNPTSNIVCRCITILAGGLYKLIHTLGSYLGIQELVQTGSTDIWRNLDTYPLVHGPLTLKYKQGVRRFHTSQRFLLQRQKLHRAQRFLLQLWKLRRSERFLLQLWKVQNIALPSTTMETLQPRVFPSTTM